MVKTCPAQVKTIDGHETDNGGESGAADGVFEALVAVFGNVDMVGDKIVKGAFADSLKSWAESGDPIPVYWSHRLDDPDMCIGHLLAAEETDDGLKVRAQLDLENPKAATTYRLLKDRRVRQFSFTYDINDAEHIDGKDSEDGTSYTELRKLALHEVGPTPIGANPATELLEVKTDSGEPIQVLVTGASLADTAAIRTALTHATGSRAAGQPVRPPARVKVGRVLSSRDEGSVRTALDKIAAGAGDIGHVLSALDTNTTDENSERPPAGADAHARGGFGSASLRLLTDLTAFEVSSSTSTKDTHQ